MNDPRAAPGQTHNEINDAIVIGPAILGRDITLRLLVQVPWRPRAFPPDRRRSPDGGTIWTGCWLA
ncbi:hypothetical protein [Actinomadura rubteroloni]|uniref:hypothetical protein n=1 Tax=Actinomadura rubteroloni TaxID=1926885 RepID=UPI000CD7EFCC|nr:hypothetical protein [Actinomadura rubteroloni]